MKKVFIRLTSLLLILFLSIPFIYGCKKDDTESDNGEKKLTVAVTILPQRAFVKAVCGELVNIITIVPPGGSPETYEPTAKQLEEFTDADIYFAIGVPLEQAKMIPRAGDTVVVKLDEKVASVYKDREFEEDERDPHNWLSPKRAVVMVKVIAEELGKLDPDNAETYNANAASYIEQLQQADTYIKGLFDAIDEEKRIFLVFHPAYGYLADDYGLTMYSLEEEGKEATVQDLQNLIDYAKEHNIKVLFTQAESGSSQPAAFVQEVGGKVVVLDPLSDDYINNIKYMAEQIAESMKA